MLAAIRLVVSENGKLIETVTKNTDTQPEQLLKSLQDFQQSANELLSKLIEDNGQSAHDSEDTESDDDDDEEDEQVSPKKRKR